MNEFQKPALLVIDMQRYYLDPRSSFWQYSDYRIKDSMEYIDQRARTTVIPNIQKLLRFFRDGRMPVIFLRLCGNAADRSDLHPFFARTNREAETEGFPDVYPLADDPMASIIPELQPEPGERIIEKTTFSGFTTSYLDEALAELSVETVVCTGLATSQCVETTARDASDRGYSVVQLLDAQADYEEQVHRASLFSSLAVCGGHLYSCDEFMVKMKLQKYLGRVI